MRGLRGSAIVLAMLLLILLSGIGLVLVSLPDPAGESSQQYHQAAVLRNVARAGAHAAIASLPGVYPDGFPRVRRLAVGQEYTGKYTAVSRKTGTSETVAGGTRGIVFEEYTVVSEGEIDEAPGRKARVSAVVRYGMVSTGEKHPRAQIRTWEEEYVPR